MNKSIAIKPSTNLNQRIHKFNNNHNKSKSIDNKNKNKNMNKVKQSNKIEILNREEIKQEEVNNEEKKEEIKQENAENSTDNTENSADNADEIDKDENANLEVLNTLKKNDKLEVQNFELKDAETSPPSRYNSGNLVIAMEGAGKLIEDEELREQLRGAGIGTSATRGEIIKKLERIQYIKINNKTQIVTPTEKGEAIFDVVNQSMPDMLNPKLTASWEKGLEMVAKKEIEPDIFMEKLEKYIQSKFDKLVVKF